MNKVIYVGLEYNILRFSETIGTCMGFEGASTIAVVYVVSSRLSTLFLFVLRAICDNKDVSICTSRRYLTIFVVAVQLIEWLTHYDRRC